MGVLAPKYSVSCLFIDIYIYQGRIQDFSKGGLKAMVISINYIIYILQLFTLLF